MSGDRNLTTLVPRVPLKGANCALLVVDMQIGQTSLKHGFPAAFDLISPGSMDYFVDRVDSVVIPHIRTLLREIREREMPVLYVVSGSTHRDLTDLHPRTRTWLRDLEQQSQVSDIYWSGDPGFSVRSEVAAQQGEPLIRKTSAGAFATSPLESELHERGIESLIVCGVTTNCCVETTAREAADRGFGCVLAADACADFDDRSHRAALEGFDQNFGSVAWSTRDVQAALARQQTL